MNIIQYQVEIIDALRYPQKHSSIERVRAYFFLVVYIISFFALIGSWFHYISGLITTMLIQIVEVIFIVMYACNLNDYKSKNMDAMQCEHSCNPVVDAYLAVRVLQLFQSFYMGSYIFVVLLLTFSGYSLWKGFKRKLHVDATNLWREINQIEFTSFVLIGLELLLLVLSMLSMALSLIRKYSS